MPKRTDIKKILIIGSGPIVIGQACEFDYSGTQACKALRSEGYKVVLVNSNPATIMTDPELADRTYIEPLSVEYLEAIIAHERPDALLPTVGGQTALNLAVALSEKGVLDEYGVELIGAQIKAIKIAEDRLQQTPGHALPAHLGPDAEARDGPCPGIRRELELRGELRPAVARPALAPAGDNTVHVQQVAVESAGGELPLAERPVLLGRAVAPPFPGRARPGDAEAPL